LSQYHELQGFWKLICDKVTEQIEQIDFVHKRKVHLKILDY